jgi:replication fork clamp-binding protein CrfC
MNSQLADLEEFTIEEFQNNFDNLMSRVEKGESFIIKSEYGDVAMLPYKEAAELFEDNKLDDIISIHTTHSDGP